MLATRMTDQAIEMERLLMCCKWKVVDLTPCVDVAYGKFIEEVVAEMETIRFGLSKNASTNDNKHSASLKESGVPKIYWCERGENTALEALTRNIDAITGPQDFSQCNRLSNRCQTSKSDGDLQAGAFEIVDASLKGAYDEKSMGKALRLLPAYIVDKNVRIGKNVVITNSEALDWVNLVEAFEIVDESLKGAYDEESMGKALRLLPGP
ncbi:hypothetical protein Tco_1569058 [Tanacetum coccineum]